MKKKPKKSVRMWIARDKNDCLFLYKSKPIKNLELNSLQWETAYLDALILDPDLFPSVKWEDNEPTKVIIRLAQYDYKKKHFRKYTCYYQ